MNNRQMSLGALIDLQIQPILKWVKVRLLLAERSKEQSYARHFENVVREGNRGLADSQKRLMNIASQLRDIGE